VAAVRVNRVYDRVTIQGEGPAAGRRCTFVRLWGCNLHCVWCDSPQTWDTRGLNGPDYPLADHSTEMTPADVARAVAALDVDLCVVTGGEPLIQSLAVIELATELADRGVATHVETNGTIGANPLTLASPIELVVVSPKLASAGAGPAKRVLSDDALGTWVRVGWPRAVFKFVIANRRELDAAAQVCDRVGVDRRARWVMPQGITPLAVATGLHDLTEAALAAGFNITGRAHVMLWGNQEGR
jgi:7-carboxy-7-deazaguanine synthase